MGTTVDNGKLWEFIKTYFNDNPQHLVRHHIDSYNTFFEKDFFRIFRENNPQILHGDEVDNATGNFKHSLSIYYGGRNGELIYFGKPVVHDEGNPHILTPNEARLRDMTYSVTVHYDVVFEYIRYVTPSQLEALEARAGLSPEELEAIEAAMDVERAEKKRAISDQDDLDHKREQEQEQDESGDSGGREQGGAPNKQRTRQPAAAKRVQIQSEYEELVEYRTEFTLKQIYLGRFPIMVQAAHCILTGMPSEMRFALGECRVDVGGYFIIDGKEKVVVPQEKFANNMLRVRPAIDSDHYDWSADILSVSENVSKPIRNLSVRRTLDRRIVVLLPNVRSPVPLFIVFRALGVISDRDVVEMCLLDTEKYTDMLGEFRESVMDAGSIYTQSAALKYIGLLTKWKQPVTAQHILADYFLPHIGETNWIQKAYYLGYMVLRLLRVARKIDEPTDRDHFKYKRMELAGELMSGLFREYYAKQLKSLHRAFESRLYFNYGMYGQNLDQLIHANHKAVFSEFQIVDQGFRKAFKGNWGGSENTKRVGVVQDLARVSSIAALDHLRKTNLPMDPSMAKLVEPRVLHGSQWGLMDPIDTPDGGNIGIHKHLSILTLVTSDVSREGMLKWVHDHMPNFYSIVEVLPRWASRASKIFVNGYWSGVTTSPIEGLRKLLTYRRNGLIPIYTSISFDYRENVIYIHTDGGRVCRPVFYWDDHSRAFSAKRIASLFGEDSTRLSTSLSRDSETSPVIKAGADEPQGGAKGADESDAAPIIQVKRNHGRPTWEQIAAGFNERRTTAEFKLGAGRIYDPSELYELTTEETTQFKRGEIPDRFLTDAALIDYLDGMESESTLIRVDDLTLSTVSPDADVSEHALIPKPKRAAEPKWTHMEIHQAMNYGLMCNLSIFLENNPANRVNFSCSQSKQAVSMYHTNFQNRMDKTGIVLNCGQTPMLKSRLLENINGEHTPYGVNTFVAIMCYTGYNVEDATLFNEGALKRGLFRTSYYNSYKAHEEVASSENSNMAISLGQIGNMTGVVGKKAGYDYSKLDENGLIREGEEVDDKTVLIGVYSVDRNPGADANVRYDCSVVPKKGAKGIVDRVFVTEGEEGKRIAKVRVRESRIPAMGDKMASRAGQKGTIGMIIPECDMPFLANGQRPDMIINPHAIPTRMTIGHMVECIIGKACAFLGGYGDCTAHNSQGSKIAAYGRALTALGFHAMGNEVLYDGLTGRQIEANIFMGPNFYMRLKHMVKDKINYRATGPNTALTRQPVSGRANDGGLRIGEMERDAVAAHGISDFLRESMLDRGDHIYLAICNTTGMVSIWNPARKLLMSPMADGPVQYVGSIEKGDMKLQQVTQYGRSFSVVKIPYVMKLFMQEMLAIGVQMRIITADNISQMENMAASHNMTLLLHPDKQARDVEVRVTRSEVERAVRDAVKGAPGRAAVLRSPNMPMAAAVAKQEFEKKEMVYLKWDPVAGRKWKVVGQYTLRGVTGPQFMYMIYTEDSTGLIEKQNWQFVTGIDLSRSEPTAQMRAAAGVDTRTFGAPLPFLPGQRVALRPGSSSTSDSDADSDAADANAIWTVMAIYPPRMQKNNVYIKRATGVDGSSSYKFVEPGTLRLVDESEVNEDQYTDAMKLVLEPEPITGGVFPTADGGADGGEGGSGTPDAGLVTDPSTSAGAYTGMGERVHNLTHNHVHNHTHDHSQKDRVISPKDLVHFRGDIKPERLWEVVSVHGRKYVTIKTDDKDGLKNDDTLKVVGFGDVYFPRLEYPRGGMFASPLVPHFLGQVGGQLDGTPIAPALDALAPAAPVPAVININTYGGDNNSGAGSENTSTTNGSNSNTVAVRGKSAQTGGSVEGNAGAADSTANSGGGSGLNFFTPLIKPVMNAFGLGQSNKGAVDVVKHE
jgi:DNA-directed RNA polymerase II subunit RPB2